MLRIARVVSVLAVLLVAGAAHAQVSISTVETTYTQDFDTLASTGTSSVVPTGWAFVEVGGNTTYAAGTGSDNSGNTYSFGAASATERAFGGVRSGTVTPTIGVQFINNTGTAIGSISVDYTGEQWRLGTAGRADRLDFQYSTDATSLTTGTWTDVDALDFVTPVTATVGAKDGNMAANRTALGPTTIALALAPAGTVWVRWADPDASGADDGLAVDDFHFVAHGTVASPRVTATKSVTPTSGPIGPTSVLHYSVDVEVVAGQGITNAVFTDTLPVGLTAQGAGFTLDSTVGAPATLTIAADADAGEIVGGVVTVRLPALGVGDLATVTFDAQVDPRTSDGMLANTASVAFDGAISGSGFTVPSNTVSSTVVRCVTTPSGTIPLCLGTIAFDVFFDTNANGMHDSGEPGLPGWNIALDAGAPVPTMSDGSATFASVASDVAHAVTAMAPASASTWSFTFPATVTTPFGTTTRVAVPVGCTCPDDGNACTPLPVCNAGSCGIAPPVDCDDHNPCTADACDGSTMMCGHTPAPGTCDDGMAGTRNDACTAGACVGTPYTCTPGVCEATSVPNGVDCTITFASATTTCGPAPSGACDAADHCSGTSATCVPTVQSGTTCRAAAGPCDVAETCDGVGTGCPTDDLASPTTECRGSTAACDPAELCDGVVVSCPADVSSCTADAGTDAAVDVDAAVETDAGVDAAVDVDAAVVVDGGGADAGAVDAGGDAGVRDGGAGDGGAGDGAVRIDGGATPPVVSNCGCTAVGGTTSSGALASLALLGAVLVRVRRRRRA